MPMVTPEGLERDRSALLSSSGWEFGIREKGEPAIVGQERCDVCDRIVPLALLLHHATTHSYVVGCPGCLGRLVALLYDARHAAG
jgi:hypothetical protein